MLLKFQNSASSSLHQFDIGCRFYDKNGFCQILKGIVGGVIHSCSIVCQKLKGFSPTRTLFFKLTQQKQRIGYGCAL